MMQRSAARKGVSLIEVVLSIGIIVLLFGGIYTAYVGIIDAVTNSEVRAAAAAALGEEIETIRNLPYESVGTVGGFPAGILPQQKTVTAAGYTFAIAATVRNIDDPFDGTLGGAPNDTAPADYKLVELEVSCTSCPRFVPLTITTTVAPKNLESALTGGSLFVNVFDASAAPVQNATVHLTNASVTPAIDLTDVTNGSGVLQLVGLPTSTQNYQITVTKSGYSSERTYRAGDPANPNPVHPYATVAAQALTEISFAIDRTSALTVRSSDYVCAPVANVPFSLQGSKKIGADPDVLKFSTSSQTDGSGEKIFGAIEWDTYILGVPPGDYDALGYMPLSPLVINPDAAAAARMVLVSSTIRSLLVTAKDGASGAGIPGAAVRVENGAGYDVLKTTGRNFLTHTSWSGGAYIDQSGGIDAESVPGAVMLVGPPYPSSTAHWFVSRTFDAGGASSTFYAFNWTPVAQPAGGALTFQIATNNDNATWNFTGPDGTAGTYYSASGAAIPVAHSGQRYLRYKAYFSTTDENVSPGLESVDIEFNGPCVPPAQSLFRNMPSGAHTVTVSASGYATATSSVTVGSGANAVVMSLLRL